MTIQKPKPQKTQVQVYFSSDELAMIDMLSKYVGKKGRPAVIRFAVREMWKTRPR